MTKNKPTVPTRELHSTSEPVPIHAAGTANDGNFRIRDGQLKDNSRAILPKWLDAMKDAMVEDANIAERGITSIYERNDQRLRILKAAIQDIAPEIERLGLGARFQILINKAEHIKEIYDEQLRAVRDELAVSNLHAAFANDRRQAALAIQQGMTIQTRGRLPVRTESSVEARSLRAAMSIGDMFVGTMEL